MPFIRDPASSDVISASVFLWDTAVGLLKAQEIGTCACDPNKHRTPPEVDFFCLSNFLQNRRLGMIPVYSLLLDFQRDNPVGSWLCDEFS